MKSSIESAGIDFYSIRVHGSNTNLMDVLAEHVLDDLEQSLLARD